MARQYGADSNSFPDKAQRRLQSQDDERAAVERIRRTLFDGIGAAPKEEQPTPLQLLAFEVSCRQKEGVRSCLSGNPGSRSTKLDFKAAASRRKNLLKCFGRAYAPGDKRKIGLFNEENLRCAIRVLDCCVAYARMEGKRPTAHDVAAMLLLHPELDGFEDQRVERSLRVMGSKLLSHNAMAQGSSRFWMGNVRNLATLTHARAIRPGAAQSVFTEVSEMLASVPGRMFLSDEIAQAVFPDLKDRAGRTAVSTVCEVLLAAGFAVKQPQFRLSGLTIRSSWSHRNDWYLRAPANSAELKVLEHAALNEGGWLIDITQRADRQGLEFFERNSLLRAARRLEELGLLRYRTQNPASVPEVPRPATDSNYAGKIGRVRLEPSAKSTVRAWAGTPLGEPFDAAQWEKLRRSLVNGEPFRADEILRRSP